MATTESYGPGAGPILDREPVAVFVGGLAAVVNAGLIAGEAVGWLSLTPQQDAALVTFVSVASGWVVATLRSFVFCRLTARRSGVGTP